MKKNETSLTATGVATRLKMFCGMITHLFAPTKKRAENNAVHAKTYLHGLLSETPRKNSEAIADVADDTQAQDIQNFMTGSRWKYDDVFAHVASKANQRIGNHPDTMLAIDESGFTKKGRSSAAVTRRYNGRMGKVDNCQVGVFSSLSNGANATLIGASLLLPPEWVKDEKRCLKAGIPKDKIRKATKIDLARELIEQADAHGVQYACIGVDSFCGRDISLLCWIEDRGCEFYADTPKNTFVWLREKEISKIPFNSILMCSKKMSQTHEEIPIRNKSDPGMRGRVGRTTCETGRVARAAPGDGGGYSGVIGRQCPHCRKGVRLGTRDG